MNLDQLWKSTLAELELTITPAFFKTAFSKSRLASFDGGIATIALSNPTLRSMVEGRYYSLIKNILERNTKENISLVFTVNPKREKLSEEEIGPLFSKTTPSLWGGGPDLTSLARKLHIRPDATFDSFAVSPSNQLAFAAATAVATTPGNAYNPLFLYGGVGVGKTHLMHAIANAILKKDPSMKVVYCMGEEFLNQIVEAIQLKTSRQFKQRYRSAQLLLVDDVQFIAGKQTAQEEFFHTFNAVHREGGQVVLTSDRAPAEISRLEDRLRSRFEGGLTVDVSQPDLELRVAIINIKALALSLSLPPDASLLIASNLTDTRAIEGFLKKLINKSLTGEKPITIKDVASLLQVKLDGNGPASSPRRLRVSPSVVLEEVAKYYQLKPSSLKGPKRDRFLARPRQLIMYICKNEMNTTLNDIGGVLGGRDHTTIMHGVEKISSELRVDSHLQEALREILLSLFS